MQPGYMPRRSVLGEGDAVSDAGTLERQHSNAQGMAQSPSALAAHLTEVKLARQESFSALSPRQPPSRGRAFDMPGTPPTPLSPSNPRSGRPSASTQGYRDHMQQGGGGPYASPRTRSAGTPAPHSSPLGTPRSPHGGWGGGGMGKGAAGSSGDVERGQGYRKLWQQVTRVGRGQKLGEAVAGHFSDMTVEDLLRIIRGLAPEESAVAAVGKGLYFLDSRALAALLKELAKAGLSGRAAELFDWLRGLPENHELASLCDVYTYTTIISQCGSHQQLRKALELVAEMRGRGVPANVHTYSALMNVCIKANELELALDVYTQLLQEGCTPNLVTYNILIDVYGKTGQWEEAVKVLDALESQGTQPEVRTYNTIMNACNRSGQVESAMKVYERMLANGVMPTATTYTALISAYGKAGKADEALRIFQDMVHRGCERNVITYSSLISACEKAGRWELALELFDEMQREGCKPNVVAFNALISACGQAGEWEHALQVFDQLPHHGCKPDLVTYGVLLAALDRGNQWRRALHVFEGIQAEGCRPDAAVYNCVIDVLWRSGVVVAQQKAMQLFQAANRHGQLRLPPNSPSDSSVIAYTPGAATVAVLAWLLELRARLGKSGFPAPSSPSSAASAPLPEALGLTLLKARHGRTDAFPAGVQEALTALLAAREAPISVGLLTQGETPGIRLSADAASIGPWLESEQFELAVAPVATPPAGLGGAGGKLAAESIITSDVSVEARCTEAFLAVKEFEETHLLSGKAVGGEEVRVARAEAVALLVGYGHAFGFQEETIHDSVQLLDRIAGLGLRLGEALAPLLAAAVILISARQGERQDKFPSEETVAAVTGSPAEAVAAMDERIRAAVSGDTGAISALRILHLFLERMGCNFQDMPLLRHMAGDAIQMMSATVFEPAFLEFRPSLLAASVIYTARAAQGLTAGWPSALASLTGYLDPTDGAFAACVKLTVDVLDRKLTQPPPPGSPRTPSSARRQVSPNDSLLELDKVPPLRSESLETITTPLHVAASLASSISGRTISGRSLSSANSSLSSATSNIVAQLGMLGSPRAGAGPGQVSLPGTPTTMSMLVGSGGSMSGAMAMAPLTPVPPPPPPPPLSAHVGLGPES